MVYRRTIVVNSLLPPHLPNWNAAKIGSTNAYACNITVTLSPSLHHVRVISAPMLKRSSNAYRNPYRIF